MFIVARIPQHKPDEGAALMRDLAQNLGHARVEIVPGAPHSMYWETPTLFNDAVGRFLADVTAAGVTRC